ncbi:hypothetical protein [Sinomonas atrocyanea]
MQPELARRRAAAAALSVGPAAVGLGLAAHLAAGGAAPPATVLLALTAVASLLAAATAARVQLPPWAIGLGSGALQQVLHLLFTALAGPNAPLLPATGHVHSHGLHSPGPVSAAGGSAAAFDPHLLVVAHVAAALLTVLAVLAANRLPQWWAAHHAPVQPSPSAAWTRAG